jgi:hypothetical protein
MATISLVQGGTTGHPSRTSVKQPYVVSRVVDFAEALATKGSALASGDVVEALAIPAGTMILAGGAEVLTSGNATAATVDVDIAAGDDYVDGQSVLTAGYLAAGTNGAVDHVERLTAADTLDLKIASLTGTLSTGTVRVYAVLVDID